MSPILVDHWATLPSFYILWGGGMGYDSPSISQRFDHHPVLPWAGKKYLFLYLLCLRRTFPITLFTSSKGCFTPLFLTWKGGTGNSFIPPPSGNLQFIKMLKEGKGIFPSAVQDVPVLGHCYLSLLPNVIHEAFLSLPIKVKIHVYLIINPLNLSNGG